MGGGGGGPGLPAPTAVVLACPTAVGVQRGPVLTHVARA